MAELYPLPDFLEGRVEKARYKKWLSQKASAHVKRDRARLATLPQLADKVTREIYKKQIHAAVIASQGKDWYTGEALEWEKISTYCNVSSKRDRSLYKSQLALLPTADHVLRPDGYYDFVICAWRTNDAKNDLSYEELVAFCEKIIANYRSSQLAHSS